MKKAEPRPERWESLRLDVQKFAPQEFVAACWDLICHGYGTYQYLKATDVHNSSYIVTVDHNYEHKLQTVIQDSTPTTPEIKSGYLHEKENGNGGHSGSVTYFYYDNKYHIGRWESTNHS